MISYFLVFFQHQLAILGFLDKTALRNARARVKDVLMSMIRVLMGVFQAGKETFAIEVYFVYFQTSICVLL